MTERTESLRVRVTAEEKTQIEARAKEHGMGISAWLRAAGSGADVGGGKSPTRSRAGEGAQAAADVSPGLTAKEWDRKVRQGDHTLPIAVRKQIVRQQFGPRPKEEE